MNRTGTQLLSGRWLTRHPWRVLVLTVALAALIGGGVAGLGFKNDYRIYFGKDNPELLAYDAIQSVYNKSDNILFVLEPASASAFTVETLSAIVELTNKAWQLPYSSRVDSLTNYQHTVADGDDIVVGDLVPDPAKLSEAELESVKRIALGEPSLLNRLVSPSGHVAGVDVTLQLPSDDPFAVVEAAERARELARELEGQYPGLKLHLTGMVMLNDAFSEAVMQDNKTLVPIMYLLLFATLMLCLRSLSATLSVMLLILVAIAMALGAAGWFGWFLTPTSAMAPPIIMTMAVADCVHILVTQLHSMRLGAPKHLAIQESLRINFQPILLTSVTTAIGFLSLNFSDAPPFRDLGNIVAIGVLWAWLLSLTLLPALMMILPVNIAPGKEPDRTVMVDLAGFVIRRRKSLLLVNGLAALVLIGLAPRNALNDEFVKYFDQTVDFRRSTDFLDANLGGMYTLELSIHAGGDGAVNEPVFLERLEALVDWLRAQPEVRNVDSITDVFKRLNKNMHRDRPEWYKLPAERELAAQYLLLYEMSLPYGLDLNDRVD
ncbi:MAG: efflux RND transporter permease subunit, partial [Gammaproteobacteria bacterium]